MEQRSVYWTVVCPLIRLSAGDKLPCERKYCCFLACTRNATSNICWFKSLTSRPTPDKPTVGTLNAVFKVLLTHKVSAMKCTMCSWGMQRDGVQLFSVAAQQRVGTPIWSESIRPVPTPASPRVPPAVIIRPGFIKSLGQGSPMTPEENFRNMSVEYCTRDIPWRWCESRDGKSTHILYSSRSIDTHV